MIFKNKDGESFLVKDGDAIPITDGEIALSIISRRIFPVATGQPQKRKGERTAHTKHHS
jgi:hypothetical protein